MEPPVPHVHATGGQSLVLLALLWLPATLWVMRRLLRAAVTAGVPGAVRLEHGLRSLDPTTAGALLLILVTAAVHVALIPEHRADPLRASLFALDSLALAAVAVAALAGARWWRGAAHLLLCAGVTAYLAYAAAGWEAADVVGVGTKLVELTAIGLLWAREVRVRLVWRRAAWP